MSFDWNEYFLLAKELSGDSDSVGNEEAKMRSAISRAYYSVLIQARTKISELTGKSYPKQKNTHAWTIGNYISYVNRQDSRTAEKIHEDLKRLLDQRKMADYENDIENLEKELKSALITAEKLIENINKLK